MIKLNRGECPEFLSVAKVVELTEVFKSSRKSVWNTSQIKVPLLKSSFGKCAYCECSLVGEGNYMEVEHFEDKASNPDAVVRWSNLLPSCKRCNGAKGSHDVKKEPILNPFDEDPREHLVMRLYRLRGKTSKGISTISVAGLNNSDRLVLSRFKIGEKIAELSELASELFELYSVDKSDKLARRIRNIVESLFAECKPSSAYAATTASILLSDKQFMELIAQMRSDGMWGEGLADSLLVAQSVALDVI